MAAPDGLKNSAVTTFKRTQPKKEKGGSVAETDARFCRMIVPNMALGWFMRAASVMHDQSVALSSIRDCDPRHRPANISLGLSFNRGRCSSFGRVHQDVEIAERSTETARHLTGPFRWTGRNHPKCEAVYKTC